MFHVSFSIFHRVEEYIVQYLILREIESGTCEDTVTMTRSRNERMRESESLQVTEIATFSLYFPCPGAGKTRKIVQTLEFED